MNTTERPFYESEWVIANDYEWREWLDSDHRAVHQSEWELHPNTSSIPRVEEGQESGPVLTATEGPHRVLHPMSRANAALFRRFADLDASNLDEILSFARTYGFLGTDRVMQVLALADGSTHHAEGEPYVLWVQEIAQIKRAMYLSNRSGKSQETRKYLEWLFGSHLQKVQGRIVFSADGELEFRVQPMTLLAAMWLQLALAVAGDKDFRKCKYCHGHIEISTAASGFRTNREFCSDSCKTNDYRKRKRTAIRLFWAKESVSVIRKKVDTPLATVRKWIAEAKSARKAEN